MKAWWVLGSVAALAVVWWTVRSATVDLAEKEKPTTAVEETKKVEEERRKKAEEAQPRPRVVMMKVDWPKEAQKLEGKSAPPKKSDETEARKRMAAKPEASPKGQPLKGQEIPPQAVVKGPENIAPPLVSGPIAKPGVVAQAGGGGGGAAGAGGFGIVADFDCDVDFYLRAMREQGARVMLYEGGKRKFFTLDDLAEEVPDGYSTTSRRLTQDYPGGREIIDRARTRIGEGHYEIILLLPAWLEDRFQQSLRRVAVSSVGEAMLSKITNFHLVYEKTGAGLVVAVDRISVDGTSVSVKARFTL
jgi:hypothetical protein